MKLRGNKPSITIYTQPCLVSCAAIAHAVWSEFLPLVLEMGTSNPRSSLQRLMEARKSQIEDQTIPPRTRLSRDNSNLINKMNTDRYSFDNDLMTSKLSCHVGRANTVMRNQCRSTVQESTVVKKKVIRKKIMMINGKLVEQEEEETEEVQPTNKEFTSQSDFFYANDNLFQGSSMMSNSLVSPEKMAVTNSNWNSLQPNKSIANPNLISNFYDNELQRKFDSMKPFNSMDNDPFFKSTMESNSMSFAKANMRMERMSAYQSSINGKMNPPVVNMESNELCYDSSQPAIEGMKKMALAGGDKALALPEAKSDDAKRKTVLQKFGFGKKKEEPMKENVRITKIIEELVSTEQRYISDLSRVVDIYMAELNRRDAPKELVTDKYSLFGNIEHIYMFHDVQFLTDLNECDKTPTGVANCFLKHAKEFALYRHYNRNKPFTELTLNKHGDFFTERQKQQNDPEYLQSYLIKPTQRIARYILLLREIAKEYKKDKISATEVSQAIQLLETEIKFGNDLMALDALKDLPSDIDIKGQGDLIYRDKFTVTPPDNKKKYEAMIFLFKEMIIISDVRLENSIDYHYYKDNIRLSEVGLTECNNDPKQFKIWYLKHNKKNYTLQTKPEIKKLWVTEIRKQLEHELNNMKAESSRNSCDAKFIDLNKKKFMDLDMKRK